ncbi:NitT/TauT family transport system substrate-binding protein [Gemmobacter megaterium]|uniref:NitT/TauT family transport system substrate-binding protein n=1 Tax=Gemmobacter megaterium TaxID=1086013 RepID=A0A1N7N3I9_9RHOB|nr:ABC transporter substrate-binding protein [Gemmobacter megaterium]GGE12844.1 hypothetical protein GCM10011345_18310 [Gemmobacter megaterium]SIS92848.1 NitT/TauT family transport system substrate-binding protein [Gemmobacter megaterium]
MKHLAFALTGGLMLALSTPALAQKIRVGCTSSADCGTAMIAVDQGIFEKHGLDVEMTRIALNSNIPPALLSNSLEIGGPTSSVFLQAVDGGLDLVAVAGASVMHEATNQGTVAVIRDGVTIDSAKDFVGKKVGVPGFGAYIHILFNRYLMAGGVDPAQVNMVETSFPSMPDVIRTGAVDAVASGGPTVQRILSSGTGHLGPRFVAELGGDAPIIFYAATRQWAEANPEAVAKFQQAIAEAAALAASDREVVIASVAKFTEQNPDLVRATPPSKYVAELTTDGLGWWLELMQKQGLLQGSVDPGKLIVAAP